MRCAMNKRLLQLETAIGLGPTYAARMLGIAYPTYAQYRSGRRPLQLYHDLHIEALLELPHSKLSRLIEARAWRQE